MAYEDIQPRGEPRADLRTGILAALLANIHRDHKRRLTPFRPADFIPQFDAPETEPQTGANMAAVAQAITQAMGGKVMRRGDNR